MVNKLFGSRCYLIGAMDRVPDGGTGWRNRITPFLEEFGVDIFNPCEKRLSDVHAIENDNNTQIRKEWKLNGQYHMFDTVKKIRTTDLAMVDRSDFIICNLDVSIHACGTYEELFWANRCKKPILVHCEQGKENCPDWLFLTLPHQHIFSSWDKLLYHLVCVSIDGQDLTGRWIIFDRGYPAG